MRAELTYTRQAGELTIEHCRILRYMDGARIQKNYQQFVISFTPDTCARGQGVAAYWAVSNWSAGAEYPVGSDLKGQIKAEKFRYCADAEEASDKIVRSKTGKGYLHFAEYGSAALVDTPPKILQELQMVALAQPTPVVQQRSAATPRLLLRGAKPAFVSAAYSPDEDAVIEAVPQLNKQVSDLASAVLSCLASDDLPHAIEFRHMLVAIIAEVSDLKNQAEGQLEIVNLKLAQALSD